MVSLHPDPLLLLHHFLGLYSLLTPVLAGAMCCYFNAVRVVAGIGNLRTPRFRSEAEPQKTMRLPIEFGLYSGVRGRRAQIQSQNDSWVWNITPAIVVNQRKWDRMGPEKVNVMKGFGRTPLGCCCSAFSARRCGTAKWDVTSRHYRPYVWRETSKTCQIRP